jgi:hypothetical protein
MALAHIVAQELDICDDMDRPLYKIKTTAKHVISTDTTCAPLVHGGTCHVVTGTTLILLDFYSAQARDMAYDAIERGLANVGFLKLFAGNVVRAQFLKPLTESLVATENDDDAINHGSVSITVTIVATLIAFFTASLVCYGLMYEKKTKKASFRNKRFHRHPIRSDLLGQYATRDKSIIRSQQRSFVRLEDGDLSYDGITDTGLQDPPNYISSITWSVSDITSDDSGSIQSNVSRTTSKLESIVEEEEEEEQGISQNRRSVSEFDCARFLKGAIYISNLSECHDSLTMPSDQDLELGMAQDLANANIYLEVPTDSLSDRDNKTLDNRGLNLEESNVEKTENQITEKIDESRAKVFDSVLRDTTEPTKIICEEDYEARLSVASNPAQTPLQSDGNDRAQGSEENPSEPPTNPALGKNLFQKESHSKDIIVVTDAESHIEIGKACTITTATTTPHKESALEAMKASEIERDEEYMQSHNERSAYLHLDADDDGSELDLDISIDVFYDVTMKDDGSLISDSKEKNADVTEPLNDLEVNSDGTVKKENVSGKRSGWTLDNEIKPDEFYDAIEEGDCFDNKSISVDGLVDKYLTITCTSQAESIDTQEESERSMELLDYSRSEGSVDDVQLDGLGDLFFVDDMSETSEVLASGCVLKNEEIKISEKKKIKHVLADNTNNSRAVVSESNTLKVDSIFDSVA